MWIGNSYLRLRRPCCLHRQVSATWTVLNSEAENSLETSMTIYKTHGVICQKNGIFVRSALRTEISRKADASDVWSERVVADVLGSEFDSQRLDVGTSAFTSFSLSSNFSDCSLNKPSSSSQIAIHIHLPRQYFKTRAGEIASPNIPRMSYFSL